MGKRDFRACPIFLDYSRRSAYSPRHRPQRVPETAPGGLHSESTPDESSEGRTWLGGNEYQILPLNVQKLLISMSARQTGFGVCDSTSPSKRDIEPAVHFHFQKKLPLLRSENSGTNEEQSR